MRQVEGADASPGILRLAREDVEEKIKRLEGSAAEEDRGELEFWRAWDPIIKRLKARNTRVRRTINISVVAEVDCIFSSLAVTWKEQRTGQLLPLPPCV